MSEKITPGKWVQRNGKIATVAGVNPNSASAYVAVGWDAEHFSETWTIEGRVFKGEKHPEDLIAPYIPPPEPLRLEVGKEYETGGGSVYRIDAAHPEGKRFVSWTPDGCYVWNAAGIAAFTGTNLVREHKPEPKRLVVWINEYPGDSVNRTEIGTLIGYVYYSRKEADLNASPDRIGRHRVELVSGKWDE